MTWQGCRFWHAIDYHNFLSPPEGSSPYRSEFPFHPKPTKTTHDTAQWEGKQRGAFLCFIFQAYPTLGSRSSQWNKLFRVVTMHSVRRRQILSFSLPSDDNLRTPLAYTIYRCRCYVINYKFYITVQFDSKVAYYIDLIICLMGKIMRNIYWNAFSTSIDIWKQRCCFENSIR